MFDFLFPASRTVRVIRRHDGELELPGQTLPTDRAAVANYIAAQDNPHELRIYGTRRALRRLQCNGPHTDIRGEYFDFDHASGWTYAFEGEP
jgi:hypothetical protein